MTALSVKLASKTEGKIKDEIPTGCEIRKFPKQKYQ